MSVKTKAIILSSVVSALLLCAVTIWRGMFDYLGISLSLAALTYIGFYWALGFEVKPMGFLMALFPPSLFVLFDSWLIQIYSEEWPILNATPYVIIPIIVFLFILYSFLVTGNIINTWVYKKVALVQVARTVFLFLSIVTFYSSVLVAIRFQQIVWVLFVILSVGIFTTISNLWLSEIQWKDALLLASVVGLFLTGFSFVLFVWPIPIEVFSFGLAVVLFVITSMSIHVKNQTDDLITWIEHLILIAVVVWVIFTSARWGIGGKLW